MKRISLMIIAIASVAASLGVAGCSQSDDAPPNTGAGDSGSAQQPDTTAAPDDDGQSAAQDAASDDDGDSDSHDDLSSQGVPPDEAGNEIDHSPESDPQSGTLEGNQGDESTR